MNTAPWRLALCSGAFAGCVAAAPHGLAAAVLVTVISCAVGATAFVDRRLLTAVVVIVASALGTWRGAAAATVDAGPGGVAGHLGGGDTVLRGSVADSGVPGRDDTFVVDVATLAVRSGAWRVGGAVVVEPRTPVDVLPGDIVDVQTSSLRAPQRRPGALAAASLERVGVVAIAAAAQVTVLAHGGASIARGAQQLRRVLSAAVSSALPEPEAALVLGIALGIHCRLDGSARTPLQDAGLIHVIAVSGLKIAMLAGLVQALARRRGWTRRQGTVATIAVVGAYVVLSGASPAALRSSAVVGAGLLLARDGRRVHAFAMLGLCAAALLAIEPAVATDIGFQLSFLGTAGILLLARPIAARVPGPRLLAEPFAVTVAAQLATAPVTAGAFGVLSLVGPFANALVLPLLPVTIVAGGAGALLAAIGPGLGAALGWLPLQLAALAARCVMAVAVGGSSLPFASIGIQLWPAAWVAAEAAAGLAAATVWSLGGGHRRGSTLRIAATMTAAAVAGTLSVGVASHLQTPSLRVAVLDVGNGVAVLVQPPGGGRVLIDGGASGPALLSALGRVLSPLDEHLDAVVLTAADRASSAAVPALLGHYGVGTLVVSQPLPAALQAAAAQLAGAGTAVDSVGPRAWTIEGATVRCIPTAPAAAAPCVVQVTDGADTVLVTGNLAQAAQDELCGVQAGRLRADLLVAPTTTAPDAALLAAVRPGLIAVPAARVPPGLGGAAVEVDVTGRDSDLAYVGTRWGGFVRGTG